MYQYNQTNEYDALINIIKRKRKCVIAFTIVILVMILIFTSPINIQVLDKTIVDYKGLNPIITVILVIFVLLIECVVYATVSSPLATSMEIESDPQKHLILNAALNKQKNIDDIYAIDYLYMGDFKSALVFSDKMINSNKESLRNIGIFNKARCEFFLGDYNSFKLTVQQFENALAAKKTNQKIKDMYDKIQNSLNLLLAITANDYERIDICRKYVEPWNNSNATQGYINYLKGIAAYYLGDKEECIYRLMAVKDNCPKTVFGKMADQYLLALK